MKVKIMHKDISSSPPVVVLRRKEVQVCTKLSRSTIYAEIKAGRFPKQFQLTSKRCVGWNESEIQDWLNARITESRTLTNGGA